MRQKNFKGFTAKLFSLVSGEVHSAVCQVSRVQMDLAFVVAPLSIIVVLEYMYIDVSCTVVVLENNCHCRGSINSLCLS